jgi:mono/diheme cytochrome c family protein
MGSAGERAQARSPFVDEAHVESRLMKLHVYAMVMLAASLVCLAPAARQSAAADEEKLQVEQLFASTCGFCHANGGRSAGRGPQLMNTQRSDDFIRERIKTGKQGAMPAFGESFSDAQIDEIIKYIRSLKPNEG